MNAKKIKITIFEKSLGVFYTFLLEKLTFSTRKRERTLGIFI